MSPDTALLIGFGLAVGGLVYLFFLVNLLAATLAALTMATYLFAYTPLKRRTTSTPSSARSRGRCRR